MYGPRLGFITYDRGEFASCTIYLSIYRYIECGVLKSGPSVPSCLWWVFVYVQVQITDLSWEVMQHMAPLIIISLLNVLTGLSGTKR